MTFDNGTESHRTRHLRYLRKQTPRAARWHAGARLVAITRKLVESKANTRTQGIPALLMGGLTRQMWVVKKPVERLRKGDKILREAKMRHFEELGATFRPIRFPKDRLIKDALSDMAKVVGKFAHQSQFGFVPKRDCVKSAAQHANAKTVFLLDLEDAFGQVSKGEVVDLLEKVFYINHKEALLIADLSCYDGKLYQGNPLSPALFNLRAVWMVERLTRLCNSCGCTVTVYADDLTISSDHWEYFSRGFQKTVYRIIHECGFKVNDSKSRLAKVSPRKVGHYDITGLTIDFDELGLPYVRPLHRRKARRKADYLAQLQAIGYQFSREVDKTGQLKTLAMVEHGIRNWSEREPDPGEYPQARLAM